VKEKYLASHVLERFQSSGEDLNSYVMSVVAAADNLGFSGSESQPVQQMLQNLHPRVKSYLLFVSRPESIRDLFLLSTTVAEVVAVENQCKRLTATIQQGSSPRLLACGMVLGKVSSAKGHGKGRCWGCGASGHFQRDCPSGSRQDCSPGRSAVSSRSQAPNFIPPRKVFCPSDSCLCSHL
jgi:hypothetical protein